VDLLIEKDRFFTSILSQQHRFVELSLHPSTVIQSRN
jgi:hypothetical protein